MTASRAHPGLRHIATNSLLLFLRMLAVMVINLYAVRLVLRGLGIEDYGIYNAVAGLVGLSTFLNGVLDISVQRFYSFFLGKGDSDKVKETYTISLKMALLLAVLVVIIFETGGLWAVHTYLVFPAARSGAVLVCYQMALLTFVCSLVRIPFTASLFAYEQMNWYAALSLAECLLRLGAAMLITVVALDALVFYSCAYAFVAVLILLAYVVYCRRHYATCSWLPTSSRHLARELFSFSGWNFFGALSKVGMIQGSLVLLNIFFGPILTAAFAVATQLQNAFTSFTNTIVLALRPAMIKSYADKNYDYLTALFYIANKGLFSALLVIAVPLISEMDRVLALWLGAADDNMVLFCRLMIIYVVVLAMNSPISIIIHATGHLKKYVLYVETVCLCTLPVEWLLFRMGCPASSLFLSLISLCSIAHVLRVLILREMYGGFSLRQYLRGFLLPAVTITLFIIVVAYATHLFVVTDTLTSFLRGTLLAVVVALTAYFLALSRQERQMVQSIVSTSKIGRLCGRHSK